MKADALTPPRQSFLASSGPALGLLFIAALSVGLSYYLWGPNLDAQWSLIDDHEIIQLGQKVSFFNIPQFWLGTEVGAFGHSVRYRPSYYFLRILECYLWGLSPHSWYLARLVMFAVAFGIFVWLLSRWAGLFLSAAFALLTLTAPYWASIWASLGPAETYACFGTALFGLGFYRRWRALRGANRAVSRIDPLDWFVLAAGAIIAVGSKENFVLLAIPTAWLAVAAWRRGALSFAGVIASSAVVVMAGAVSLAIALALSSSGRDVYMNTVAPADRLPAVLRALGKTSLLWVFAAVSAAWLALLPWRRKGSQKAGLWHACLRDMWWWEAVLLALYAGQLYYYNSTWPADSRYAFPGQLAAAFALLVPVVTLARYPQLLPAPGPKNATRIRFTTGLVLLLVTWFRGFDSSVQKTRQNAIVTRSVTTCLDRVSAAAAP